MARSSPKVRDGSLYRPGVAEPSPDAIPLGSAEWYAWLEGHRSFSFEAPGCTFTARKEERTGGWYWYAYRRRKGKLHTAYLGKSAELTNERMLAVAAELAGTGASSDLRVSGDDTLRLHQATPLPQPLSSIFTAVIRPEAAPTHNLPLQLTPLIGRELDTATARALLQQPEIRLLTLIGTAGIGKTRLALQVAADLLDQFAHGTWFVPLASISDPELVTPAIAQVLGLKESANRPFFDLVKAYLQHRHLLLVLDNFEQVVSAAPHLSELLTVCSQVKLLVTSRAVLHLHAEQQFVVPPLAIPDLKRTQDSESLSQYAAVTLFVRRAQAVRPEFSLGPTNAAAVAEICVRLDGLPLAIELAAARIKLLSPQALLARLEHRLQVLTRGAIDLPERQQALWNTVKWSYDLLSVEEQRLFQVMSVFAGGCTLEAVEAVWSTISNEPAHILDGLMSLLDKSLVQQHEQAGGESRLVMLETIREYASECLEMSGEADVVRRAHISYFLTLAEEAAPALRGPQQVLWLERLEREHDNLRAALRWTLEQGAAGQRLEIALRLGGALWRFWQVRGHVSEGRQWLEIALTADHAGVAPARAQALYAVGMLTMDQGDYQQTVRFCEASLALFRELGDQRGMAASLNALGYAAHRRGENATSRALLEEGFTMARATGDREGIAQSLFFLAAEAGIRGQYVAARSMFEESLAISRGIGDISHIAQVLVILADMVFDQGEYALAQSLAEEGLALSRELGNFMGFTYRHGLITLHNLAFYQSDFPLARSILEEALAIARKQGDREEIAHILGRLGVVALYQGNYVAARSLLEEGITLGREVGCQMYLTFMLGDLGRVFLYQSDFVTARTYLEEDVAIASGLGDQRTISYALGFLGQLALYQGDWTTARSLMEESLLIHREIGDQLGTARRLYDLARVAFGESDVRTARALYEEALTIFLALKSKWFIAASFEGLAAVVLAQGKPAWAAQLWGAAEMLREGMGTPLPPIEHPAYERMVAVAHTQLGENTFAAVWDEGRAMTPEQVLASPKPAIAIKLHSSPANPYDLTRREVEVLRLVAQGFTNGQIAEQLILSPHTVNNHLRSILSKLGVTSRSGATRFAVEHGLL